MIRQLPPATELRSVFRYDRRTGVLYWRAKPYKANGMVAHMAGKPAGSASGGYVHLKYDGRSYRAHRIIWKMVTGREPPIEIDHRDGDGLNNRWRNIRRATHAQNTRNARKRHNKSLPKGIDLHRGKYRARVRFNGRMVEVGEFADLELAIIARRTVAADLHGDFARHA